MHVLPLPAPADRPVSDAGLGCLETGRGNLPLEEVDVRARVTGLAARVQLIQAFHNAFDEPLEATYVFPLPARAAVTALRMEVADRVVEAELREREEAREAYERAIEEGRRAAIAEEERPDVFTLRVGNIPPGERAVVRLTMTQPLPYEDEAATFRFPLVVAPRYVPGAPLPGSPVGDGTAPDTDAVPDASRIIPPVLLPGFPDPVRLALRVDIDPGGLTLKDLASSLHAVAEKRSAGDRVSVEVHPGERIDRDFILRLGYEPGESSVTVTPDDSGAEATFAVTVLPPRLEAAPRPRDVVLVLDRSGSMRGWKIVAARRAAARIVDTLRSRDRFAVLSFDNTVERPPELGESLAEAGDRNRFRAVEHLAGLEARGGTEMLRPLLLAAGMLADEGRDRVLVLVTDGQVANEDQIVAKLAPALGGVRVHTVGIDQAVNAGFLTRVAAIGRGRCELVESESRLDAAMDHIHRRIGSPIVTGVGLATDGVAMDGLELVDDTTAPSRLPDLYPGVPLTVHGRCRGSGGSVTLSGTAADGTPWRQRLSAELAPSSPAPAIWARGHLRDLEDRYVTGESALEDRITRTSLRFGVLCRFTAFVAVDTEIAADGSRLHRVIQPVEAPRGWEMPQPGFAPQAAAMPAGRMGAGASRVRRGAQNVSIESLGIGGPRLPSVAGHIQAELTALTEATGLSEPEKRSYLADLATRLQAIAPTLPDLEHLIVRLRACEADGPRGDELERLWQETIDTLRRFAGDRAGDEKRRARRTFWKRT